MTTRIVVHGNSVEDVIRETLGALGKKDVVYTGRDGAVVAHKDVDAGFWQRLCDAELARQLGMQTYREQEHK